MNKEYIWHKTKTKCIKTYKCDICDKYNDTLVFIDSLDNDDTTEYYKLCRKCFLNNEINSESTFIERLEIEHKQLKEKIDKLNIFTSSDKFKSLTSEHQILLEMQFGYMIDYYKVLEKRLKLIKEENNE